MYMDFAMWIISTINRDWVSNQAIFDHTFNDRLLLSYGFLFNCMTVGQASDP